MIEINSDEFEPGVMDIAIGLSHTMKCTVPEAIVFMINVAGRCCKMRRQEERTPYTAVSENGLGDMDEELN